MLCSNLGDIITRVKHELRGLPNVAATRTNLRQLATEVQREIVEEHPYPFMRETRQLVLLPDFELTQAQCLLLDFLGTSTQRVFFTGRAIIAAALGLDDDMPGAGPELLERLNGATFDLADRTLRGMGDGNWSIAPFEVYNAQISATLAPSFVYLRLDDRADINAMTGDEGNFVVRFPRVLLDPAIGEVLWLRERATGAADLRAIATRDGLTLEEHRAGDPAVWWMDDGFRPRFGPGGVTSTAFAPLSAHRSINASLGRQLPAPVNASAEATKFSPGGISLTTNNDGSGTLPVGKYRVALSWLAAGRLSPLSQPLEASIVASAPTYKGLTLTGLPVRPHGVEWDGWVRTVWVSRDDGPFYLYQTGEPGGATPTGPSGAPSPSTSTALIQDPIDPSAMDAIRWDDAYAGGQHKYLVVWPRPTTVRYFEMGVVRRPRALIEDTDVPHLPIEFNDLIVWEMCARIAAVQNADSETAKECRKLADRRLNALKSKFGMNRAVRHQRAALGAGTDFGDRFELTVDYRAD